MIKFIDVDRILKLCILYIYIYKEYFRLSQAYLFRAYIFSTQLVLGLFLQILPVIVNRQIKCRWQEDNK